eukprot:762980-Hanusia_phi.AAC.3
MAGAKSLAKNAAKVEENVGTRRLLGTFTAPPPLCLGEPYVSSYIRPERHKGKQLTAGPLRHENSKVFPVSSQVRQLIAGRLKVLVVTGDHLRSRPSLV